jgi:hypothetical protein
MTTCIMSRTSRVPVVSPLSMTDWQISPAYRQERCLEHCHRPRSIGVALQARARTWPWSRSKPRGARSRPCGLGDTHGVKQDQICGSAWPLVAGTTPCAHTPRPTSGLVRRSPTRLPAVTLHPTPTLLPSLLLRPTTWQGLKGLKIKLRDMFFFLESKKFVRSFITLPAATKKSFYCFLARAKWPK